MRSVSGGLAALAIAFCAGPAVAGWEGRTIDDGALFYGLAVEQGSGLTILCIGPSAGGVAPLLVGAHETAQTAPYALRIEFPQGVIPETAGFPSRGDVVIWADDTGYRLPATQHNEMGGYWGAEVAMTDPLVAAMRGAGRLRAGPEAGPVSEFAVAGLDAALGAAMEYCTGEFARVGYPVPPGLGGSAPAATGMRAAAEVSLRQGCSGGYRVSEGAFQAANIDGDGAEDIVLDWGSVECDGAMRRPFCGASQCLVEVFMTAAAAQGRGPEQILAQGAGLVPLSNGSIGVRTGLTLESCKGAVCAAIWYWTGAGFERLQ